MRNRGMATLVVSLGLCLLLFGALAYAVMFSRAEGSKVLDRTMGEVRLSLMVVDSLSEARRGELEQMALGNAEVERTVFISKAEARAEFERSIGHQMKMGIDLPASIEVYYHGGSAATARLLSRFAKCEGVREVVCDPSIASRRDTLEDSLALIQTILITFVALVVLVLLYFVVASWVRRAQGDYKALVGYSLNAGALAGVVSGVLLLVVDQSLSVQLPEVALGLDLAILVASMMVVSGVVIAILFTYMSIKTQQR